MLLRISCAQFCSVLRKSKKKRDNYRKWTGYIGHSTLIYNQSKHLTLQKGFYGKTNFER
jgi:hypothetical protein